MSCNQHSYYRLNAAGLFAMITSHKYPQRISSIGWKGCAKPRCALQGGSCDETIARDLLLRPACHISPFPDRSFAPMGAYGNLQNQIAKGVGSFLPALGTVLASQASQGALNEASSRCRSKSHRWRIWCTEQVFCLRNRLPRTPRDDSFGEKSITFGHANAYPCIPDHSSIGFCYHSVYWIYSFPEASKCGRNCCHGKRYRRCNACCSDLLARKIVFFMVFLRPIGDDCWWMLPRYQWYQGWNKHTSCFQLNSWTATCCSCNGLSLVWNLSSDWRLLLWGLHTKQHVFTTYMCSSGNWHPASHLDPPRST